MDTQFWTKSDLYTEVDKLRAEMDIPVLDRPVYAREIAAQFVLHPRIEEIPFSDNTICGILYRGQKSTSIALNAKRTPGMQNFDCMHELIHYFFHDIPYCKCICAEKKSIGLIQNASLEWQANEGAAQFLVPYQDFIPRFAEYLAWTAKGSRIDITAHIADHYHVSSGVIANRIRSLSFEIEQYQYGIPVRDILLVSSRRLQRENHTPPDYLSYCQKVKPRSDYYKRLIPIQEVLPSILKPHADEGGVRDSV